jgi:hypothetical protein
LVDLQPIAKGVADSVERRGRSDSSLRQPPMAATAEPPEPRAPAHPEPEPEPAPLTASVRFDADASNTCIYAIVEAGGEKCMGTDSSHCWCVPFCMPTVRSYNECRIVVKVTGVFRPGLSDPAVGVIPSTADLRELRGC